MTSSQSIMLAILIAYLAFNVITALLYSRSKGQQTTSAEKHYFIGGRNITGFVLAMTTMATYVSVSSFVSGPGAAALTYGYAQTWVAAVQVPMTFMVLGVLGNKLALISRRTGAVTVTGYLKARYQSDLLTIAVSLLMVAFFIAQMVSQFTGGATLISSITGLRYPVALCIFALIVVIYTAFGGFCAVAITDAIQGLIMCIGTFLLLFYVLRAGGGLSGIDAGLQENLPGIYDNLCAKYRPGTLLSFWVLVGFGTLGLPQTAVRAMSFKDTRSLHNAMWIGAVTCTFIIVGMHLAGTWAGALADKANLPTTDYFIPYIVQKIMPTGLAGIFLAAPMAAVMSTADSLLLLASAAIIRDIWKEYVVRDNPQRLAAYNRAFKFVSIATTLLLGGITLVLALDPPDIIFFLNLFALGGLECSFFWPLVGGLFWRKGNKYAAVSSAIGGAVTYVLCHYFVKCAGIHAVVWGLLAGAVLYFAVGAITCRRHPLDKEILDKCF